MMKSIKTFFVATSLVVFGLATIPAAADPLDELFYPADSNSVLPIERILDQVRASVPGTIVEVELEHEHGRLIYEILILTSDNKKVEIEYDARTGAEISREVMSGKSKRED
jgi:uncharacterized membrane protein YkoI